MNPCVFTVNLSARGCESLWCETLCAARVRGGFGAVPAPGCVARWAWLFFEIFVRVGTEGMIAFRNEMLLQMRRRRTCGV